MDSHSARTDSLESLTGARVEPSRARLRDLALTAFVTLAALAFYVATRQPWLFGDGLFLVRMAAKGSWHLNKVLYPPLADVAMFLAAPFGPRTPEPALLALSSVASALAVGVTYRTARLFTRELPALLACTFLALCPTVWFFATVIEVHPPQFLVAALALHWATKGILRAGATGPRPMPWPALVFLGLLVGTHLTGVLWAPATVLFLGWSLQGPERARLRWLVVSLAVPLLVGAVAFLARSEHYNMYSKYLESFAATPWPELLRAWNGRLFARELGLGLGLLLPAAALGTFGGARAPWRQRPGTVLALALIATFVCALPLANHTQRGAYYVSLYPLLAVSAARLFERLPRAWLVLVALALVPHVRIGLDQRGVFEERYPPLAWVETLVAETDGRAVVIVRNPVGGSVRRHSPLFSVTLDQELLQDSPVALFDWAQRRKLRIAVTRAVLAAPTSREGEVLAALEARLGAPQPGADPAYVLFPAPAGPPARD